jgi:hypothetical protein
MPDIQQHEEDPGASTEMFRAFVADSPSEPAHSPRLSARTLIIVAVALVVIAIIAAIAVY